jgi:dTDP-4-dehydrorhamnose reductase
MRAVVIGGSGQIGGWLLRWLVERGHRAVGTYATVEFPGLVHLDATDLPGAAAWLREQRADVVFYPAGLTWVDGCERDPDLARSANLEQPLNLARVAAEQGARFVYFSTDYLFDGRDGPYVEEDPPRPLSVYGRAKYEAELALAEALGEALLTVRTTWAFGPERQGKNFAYQLVKTLGAGRPLVCPSDQVSNPSYSPDITRAVVLLAEAGHSGLIHVAGPDWIDRVRFAHALAATYKLDTGLIVARTTAELGQAAARPLRGGLRTRRLDACLPGVMRPLDQCLADFLAQMDGPGPWARPVSRDRT